MKHFTLLFAIIICVQIASAQSWLTTRNAGLSSTSNYIGTNDAVSFIIKVNKIKAGFLDYKNSNSSFGYQSMLNTPTTNRGGNSAYGYQSLYSTSTGTYNTATGQTAMYLNTSGASNVADGVRALYSNTTASFNTAVGNRASYSNTIGASNTAIGNRALYSNTNGYSNVAVGTDALYSTDISNLVAIGDSALYQNHSDFEYGGGDGNTAVGSKSLFANYAGSFNTAMGFHTLYRNSYGSQNVAIGYQALYNQNGIPDYGADWVTANVAIGYNSLYNTNGYDNSVYNTGVGTYSLLNNTDGGENTANGTYALYTNTTGYSNTALGYFADVTNGALYNATAIGNYAKVDASNKVRIGNTSVGSIGGQVGWTVFSDGRYKKNIKENVVGLQFINSLKPITYTVDVNGLDSYFKKGKSPEVKATNADKQKESADEASRVIYSGFIAQDVETAAKKLNYEFSGVDKPASKDGLYGLRYDNFVVPLVKAVQELSAKNEELEQRLAKLEALVASSSNNQQTSNTIKAIVTNAALEQNTPNPFSQTTTLHYQLPNSFSSAKVIVTDKGGKTLKEIQVSGSGEGSILLDASTLSSGAYQYSLWVDGKRIDTKQMLLSK